MFKKTIFSKGGGMGIISDKGPNHPKITPEKIQLHGVELNPGDLTTLDGYFNGNVMYVGLMKNENHKVMCFYLGKTVDIFQELHYYNCLIHITETKIVNKFTHSSARPFEWNGSQWK